MLIFLLVQNDRNVSIQGHCVTRDDSSRGPRNFVRGHIVSESTAFLWNFPTHFPNIFVFVYLKQIQYWNTSFFNFKGYFNKLTLTLLYFSNFRKTYIKMIYFIDHMQHQTCMTYTIIEPASYLFLCHCSSTTLTLAYVWRWPGTTKSKRILPGMTGNEWEWLGMTRNNWE